MPVNPITHLNYRNANDQALEAERMSVDSANKLGDFFAKMAESKQQGQQEQANIQEKGRQEEEQEKLKSQLGGETTQRNLGILQNYMKNGQMPNGLELNLGATGGVEAKQNPMTAYLKGDQTAYQSAANVYNKGQTKLSDEIDAVANIGDALKNNNAGAMGQLRAAMLKANGFSRFNEAEARQSMPDSAKSEVNGWLQKNNLPVFSFDANKDSAVDKGVMNDAQKGIATQFAQGKLQQISARHNQLKSLASQNYKGSPMANPQRDIGSDLGAPLDQRLQQLGSSFVQSKQGGGQGNTPKVGDVVQGYKFKGGDPSQQSSWEQAQ